MKKNNLDNKIQQDIEPKDFIPLYGMWYAAGRRNPFQSWDNFTYTLGLGTINFIYSYIGTLLIKKIIE